MLPGFRFLFAAVMLSMSLLIFGLGAAALLRAAHESFASNSSWHAAPEVPFAQRPDTLPVLAALRVDTNAMETTNDQATVGAAPLAQPPPSSAAAAQNDQFAALRPVDTSPSEAARPAELPVPMLPAETPPAAETAVPPAVSPMSETAAAVDERKVAVATPDTTPPKSEPAKSEPTKAELAPQAEQVNATPETTDATVTAPADSLAATRIATLGGPPVEVTDGASILAPGVVKLPRPRPDISAIKKRVQARRAMQRRQLALRARLLLQQQQAYPFGQPPPFPPPAAAH